MVGRYRFCHLLLNKLLLFQNCPKQLTDSLTNATIQGHALDATQNNWGLPFYDVFFQHMGGWQDWTKFNTPTTKCGLVP